MTTVETILTEAVIDIDQSVRSALELKSAAVHTITPDQSVHSAITRMSEEGIGCLVVVDQHNNLAGIISERDYCRKVILMGRNSHGTRVREVMTAAVITIGPSASLREAMELMTEQRLRHLPVVEDRSIVGLLSIGDVVKWVLGEQRQTIRDLRDQLATQLV
jgi:signal-transduction protein with cAMP-binding, CBS, and nucleotidyltransferase domain